MTDSDATSPDSPGVEQNNQYYCQICNHRTTRPGPDELGQVHGNTQRFLSAVYPVWKCPSCLSIHSVEPVDMEDIYSDYPLNRARTLDVFARGTFKNLLGRLTGHGVAKQDTIIDLGCGNGVFVQYLKGENYQHVSGYDPYVEEYSNHPPTAPDGYDCVIANDVIEHVDSPRALMKECIDLVKPGGLLYVGTADSQGVTNMADLVPHTMRLHQPFHRVILTQDSLLRLGSELGLEVVQSYKRSYMDTLMPFSNYRFLDEFNKAHGHNLDAALAPDAAKIILRNPGLLFYAFCGYFLPSAYEPAVLWRKP